MPVDENWMLRALLGGAAPPPAAPLPPRPLPPIAPPLPPAALLGVQQAFPGLNPMLVPPAGMPGVLAGVDQLRGMTPPAPPPALPTPGLATNALMQALVGGIVPGVAPLPPRPINPAQIVSPAGANTAPAVRPTDPDYALQLAALQDPEAAMAATLRARMEGPIGPLQETTREIGGGPVKTVATKALDLLNKPAAWSAEGYGEHVYQYYAWQKAETPEEAQALGLIPADADPNVAKALFERGKGDYMKHALVEGPFGSTSPVFSPGEDWQLFAEGVIDAYRKGYTAKSIQRALLGQEVAIPTEYFEPGGRAVWEYVQGKRGLGERIAADIAGDPLNLLGVERPVARGIAETGAEMAARAAVRTVDQNAIRRFLATAPGKALQGAGLAIQAPDAVLNRAPDLLVGGPLAVMGAGLRKIPGVNRIAAHLAEYTKPTQAELARDALIDADTIEEALRAAPTEGAPTGAADLAAEPPPPSPTTVTRAPTTGPIQPGVIVDANQPTTVRSSPNAPRDPNAPVTVTRGSDGTPITPQEARPVPPQTITRAPTTGPVTPRPATVVPEPVTPPTPEPPPTRTRGRFTYVGWDESRRVTQTGRDTFRVDARDGKGRWQRGTETFDSAEAAVDAARTAIDADAHPLDTPTDRTPEPPPSSPPPPGTTQTAMPPPGTTQTAMPPPKTPWQPTPEERTSVLKERTRRLKAGKPVADLPTPLTPYVGGPRLQDQAYTRSFTSPEEAARYERFRDDIRGRMVQHQAAQDQLERAYFPDLEEKVARQTVAGIDLATETVYPAYLRHYPGALPDLLEAAAADRAVTKSASGKASFRTEKTPYLMQRAVYHPDPADAEAALTVLRKRWAGNPWADEVLDRLAVARERYLATEAPLPTQQMHAGLRPPNLGLDEVDEAAGRVARTVVQPNANPFVPPEITDLLAQPFTGAADPTLIDMTARQVIDHFTAQAAADQALYRQLADAGYSPERYRGSAPKLRTTEQRIKVQVGTKPGPRGRQVPASEWRTTQAVTGDPNEAMAALRERWKHGGDIAETSPRQLGRERAGYEKMRDVDPVGQRQYPLALDLLHALFFRLPRHLLLADPLTSWGYTSRNMLGNLMMGSIGRDGVSEWSIREMIDAGRDPASSVAGDLLDDLGLGRGATPRELGRLVDKMDPTRPGRSTPTRRLFARLHLDAPAKGFDWKRGLDQQIERGMKVGGTFAPLLRSFAGEEAARLTDDLAAYAAKRGIPVTRQEIADVLWEMRTAHGVFDQHRVHDAIERLGAGVGLDPKATRTFAEHAARQWTGRAKRSLERALTETNRRFPTYRQRNIDRYASWLTLFHFWPTRASRFLIEESLRDPRLVLWWSRAHAGLERMAERGDYPPGAKGLIWLAQSPFGFALYANPAALFLVTALIPDRPETPDRKGVTGVGGFLNDLRQQTGLGPTPFIDAVLNVAGIYGDAFPANPWPSRTAELAGSALDAVLVHMGHDPGTPVYDQAMVDLRAMVSAHVPWSEGVPATDVTGYRADLVGSMVLDQNPDIFQGLLSPDPATQKAARDAYEAIMANEDDPRYQAAERAVYDQELLTKTINAVGPLPIKGILESRARLIEANKEVRAIPFEQRTPEQTAIVETRAITTQTAAARDLGGQADEYRNLGTERQQLLNAGWRDIAFGELGSGTGEGFWINGKTWTGAEFNRLSDDEKRALADEWLASQNGTEELADLRDKQDAFRAEPDHGAYAGFDHFQDIGRAFPGGIPAYRAALMEESQAYRAYISRLAPETRRDPKKLDQASISEAAYLALAGEKASVYDAELPGGSSGALLQIGLAAMTGGGGGGKKEPASKLAQLKEDLASFEIKERAYDLAFTREAGGTPRDQLAPWLIEPTERRLELRGVEKPSRSKIVSTYLAWKEAMLASDPNADVTPAAYIRMMEEYARSQEAAA